MGEDRSDLVDIEWVAKRLGVTHRFVRQPVEVQRFIDKGRRPESA